MFMESGAKSRLAPAERNVSFEAEGRVPKGAQYLDEIEAINIWPLCGLDMLRWLSNGQEH